jgi:hypothetical protein
MNPSVRKSEGKQKGTEEIRALHSHALNFRRLHRTGDSQGGASIFDKIEESVERTQLTKLVSKFSFQ